MGCCLILVSSVMKRILFAALAACALPFVSCSKDFDNSTVSQFDLSRYLGEWYEVARYDHSFERGMDNTMAQYILQDDGKVVDGRMMNVTDFGEGGLSVTVNENGMYGNLMFTSEAIELDTIGRIVAGIEF